MTAVLRPFWLALQFLTRLPVPAQVVVSDEDIGRSMVAFPAVGLVLGLVLTLLHMLLSDASALLQAALALVLWVAITGNLHLDGLADTADALAGGQGEAERTLEIMKDARAGPAAVSAVGLVLILKFAALTVVLGQGVWIALLLAPVLGRAAALGLFLLTPYVRSQGLGSAYMAHLPRTDAWWALTITAVVLTLFGGWNAIGAVTVAGLTLAVLRFLWLRHIGGTTGDTAGATIELVEAAVLVTAALT